MAEAGELESPGLIVAALLEHSWRAVPSSPSISLGQLEQIAPLLLRSGAAALAWWRIRNSPLSQFDCALPLKQAYQLHSIQSAVHKTEIEEVVSLLNSAGIEPVFVKGWTVATLYPEEGLRPYGDIDLCFSQEDYQRAK